MAASPLVARGARRLLRAAVQAAGREVARELERRRTGPPRAAGPLAGPVREPVVAGGAVALAVDYGWRAAVLAFALVVLNVDLLIGDGTTAAVLRLALGSILTTAALFLLNDWLGARQRLLQRRLERAPARRRGTRRTDGGWRRRLAGSFLSLVGGIWLALGAFELLRGALGVA